MGHYATDLLIWLVREHRQLTVEDAHFQLSLKSAQSVAIHDREALLPGYWADVVVYDLDELYFDMSSYETVHDMPNGGWRRSGRACGYRHVLVNGEGPNACTFDRHVEDASFPPGDVPRLVAQQLAGWVGATREAVSRTLADLADEGIVALGRGEVRLLV